MQFMPPSSSKRLYWRAETSGSSTVGTSPIGQASTHLPQCRQAVIGFSSADFAVSARMPEVPFTTGTSMERIETPIIGPPERIFTGCSLKPPQRSTSSRTDVPSGTEIFFGCATASPVTVTTRVTAGSPSAIAR